MGVGGGVMGWGGDGVFLSSITNWSIWYAVFCNATFQVTKGVLSIGTEPEHHEGYSLHLQFSASSLVPPPIKLIHHWLESLTQTCDHFDSR